MTETQRCRSDPFKRAHRLRSWTCSNWRQEVRFIRRTSRGVWRRQQNTSAILFCFSNLKRTTWRERAHTSPPGRFFFLTGKKCLNFDENEDEWTPICLKKAAAIKWRQWRNKWHDDLFSIFLENLFTLNGLWSRLEDTGLNKFQLILYQSKALFVFYNSCFECVKIGRSVRPQSPANFRPLVQTWVAWPGSFDFNCDQRVVLIKFNTKDVWKSVKRAIKWCIKTLNSITFKWTIESWMTVTLLGFIVQLDDDVWSISDIFLGKPETLFKWNLVTASLIIFSMKYRYLWKEKMAVE